MTASNSAIIASLDRPVVVVAHDAGASNHIAYLLGGKPISGIHGSFSGPALEIMSKICPWLENRPLLPSLENSAVLLSGTSWASHLEHNARTVGKAHGCRLIAVLDHWSDYRVRFSASGCEVLPDELWVFDNHAEHLAQQAFPGISVVKLHNDYLASTLSQVTNITPNTQNNVLYLLEPLRSSSSLYPQSDEFTALDFFIRHRSLVGISQDAPIRLRPHPSDPPGKYLPWLASQCSADVSLDQSTSLAEAISRSGTVVGCQTYAMVVALAAGRKVISSLPPDMPPSILPHKDIVSLASIINLHDIN